VIVRIGAHGIERVHSTSSRLNSNGTDLSASFGDVERAWYVSIVKDRIRLWKEGVRDLVMELCCALHNGRDPTVPVNM
jgi:hypothetical protein